MPTSEKRRALRAQGKCVMCQKPSENYRCPTCADKHNALQRFYKRRSELCITCGFEHDKNGRCAHCESIRAKEKGQNGQHV